MALRDEFYSEVFPIVRSELPSVRTDLQRRIAKAISTRLAKKVSVVVEENDSLRKQVALVERSHDDMTKMVRARQAEIIRVLDNLKEKLDGKAA